MGFVKSLAICTCMHSMGLVFEELVLFSFFLISSETSYCSSKLTSVEVDRMPAMNL